MNSIGEIKAEKEKRVAALMEECHVFWAFNNEQFEEGRLKHPLAEGDKYVRIAGGGLMYRSKIDAWETGWKELNKWFKKAIKDTKGARRAHIVYELGNHEAWYTNDIGTTMDALGEGYTKKEVWKVWYEEQKKQEAA